LRKNWIDVTAKVMERLVPDAITTSILLMVILFITSVSLGTTVTATVEAYYRGLWMQLAFTMQMTLILVLSLILGATPAFRKLIIYLSRIPKNAFQVVAMAVLTCSVVAYLNWGLSQALGPLIAIHFCKEAERKGIKVDFLFMLATLAGAGSIWQFGLSASAPLLMATPGHFLEQTTGIMSLRSTIWAPAAIILVIVFTVAVIAAGYLMMPKKVRLISEFPESNKLAEAAITSSDPEKDEPAEDEPGKRAAKMEKPPAIPQTLPQKLEASIFVSAMLCIALLGWLYMHFFIKKLSLDINALNTIFLLLCFIFHRNVLRFTKALQEVVGAAWPIIVMYHLYAGVAGLIQFTPVGEKLASLMDPISTQYSYPFLTALISTVVAIFIPTSGGQWLIQGLITVKAAEVVGVTAQRGLLALSIGDHMGNLISPFWAVVGASIARIDFRLYFGYRLIFAIIWFILGVLAFTFLPC
jgi:short-chain fatty acids transporter